MDFLGKILSADDLINKQYVDGAIPTKLTELTNDAGFITLAALNGYAKTSDLPTKTSLGLGNVENTALSTWAGTNKITTLGTITSGTWNGSKIANAYLANSAITIAGTSVSLGGSISAATITAAQIGSGNTLIHSGNIGSYTAGSAWALRINEIANVNDAITQSFFMAGFQAANRPDTSQNYSTGITLHNNALGYTYQLAYSTSNALYSRRKTGTGWGGWKQLAFTDSDITGNAAGLKHSNGTIGAVVNPSGNVLIGTTADNGTKLRVEGKVFVNRYGAEEYTGGADIIINKAGTYYIGMGASIADNTKFVIGRLATSTGAWASEDIILSDNGAVTMSSTLSVSGQTTINSNLIVAGDTSSGSDIRFKDKLSDYHIALSDIANAPLFTFRWNDREDESVHLGSSAQYWEKVAPWLVKGEDFKTLDYSTLGVAIGISLANKAVNHEERIKILEKENKALKEQIRRIQYGS